MPNKIHAFYNSKCLRCEKVNKAKEIISRNRGEQMNKRFDIETYELDKMPYDREKEKGGE